MTSDNDLRDNTRAMNNLARGMASLEKVCAELNKNLVALARDGEMVGETFSGFQFYLRPEPLEKDTSEG